MSRGFPCHPDRVRRMSREWFRLAREVDRLPERKLQPVKDKLVPLFVDQYPTTDPGAGRG